MCRALASCLAALALLLASTAARAAEVDVWLTGQWAKARVGAVDIRVIGGSRAAQATSSWQVALMDTDMTPATGVFCGGTLIGGRWVLTAAHCFVDERTCLTKYSRNMVWVVHGTADLAAPVQKLAKIKNIHSRRASFDCVNKGDDLALLELEEALVGFTPMGLPSEQEEQALLASAAQTLKTSGWGWTQENGKLSQFLMEVDVPLVERDRCEALLAPELTVPPDGLCAGDVGKDACTFDSGGPLFRRGPGTQAVQFGIVSFGSGCGRRDKPGVYTRVAAHRAWIDATLKPAAACTQAAINAGLC